MVLIAGATGSLGRHLLSEFARRGRQTRALVRDRDGAASIDSTASEAVVADLTDPHPDLARACCGVETVISVAGQSTASRRMPDRRGFFEVDYVGNTRLLEAAEAAGARRFLYLSVFNAERLRGLEYVDAHERVVERLLASELEATIVRANGFFSGYLELLELARAGRPVPVLLGGSARSNPVHEADLAVACLEALEAGEDAVDVGGPEILTRLQEIELAFAAAGRQPRTIPVHPWFARALSAALRPFDRRRSALLTFLAAINTIDMVAPKTGHRDLGSYLVEYADTL